MEKLEVKLGIKRHLAKRLYPLTLLIGFLISVGFPLTFYILESATLERTATFYAKEYSKKLEALVLDSSSLWKYQHYKYKEILRNSLAHNEVATIRVLDEAGQPIADYEYTSEKAKAWWNLYTHVGSAPIVFNRRQVGTIQVEISKDKILGMTFVLLLVSTVTGTGLAVLVYHFPTKIVAGMEKQLQNSIETIQHASLESDRLRFVAQESEAALQQAHDELEIRVAQRTDELNKTNAQLRKEITERKRAEEEQQKLVDLVENSSDFIGLATLEDQMLFVNDAGKKLVGLEGDEIKQTVVSEYFAPEDLADFKARILPIVMEHGRWEGDFRFRHFKTGALIPVRYNFFAIKNRQTSQPIAVAIVSRDITELKRAEADIRTALEKEKELGELKSRFVTIASHEFRTPLATILSSTELLEHYSHKLSEEKKLNHFQRIQVAVKQMTSLLNDVLLIGKAEAGKLEFMPTPLDLAQFCRDLVEEMQLITSTHTIDFRTQSQCINACMDEKLLRHILSNLLSNAIKYSPQGGTVHFDLVCEREEAIFRIQDEGIGIPTADQAKLFNSFQRASNVGNISGTGLGLAIAKKSVDLHAGNITVNSDVGVSTTFSVMLPLNKQV